MSESDEDRVEFLLWDVTPEDADLERESSLFQLGQARKALGEEQYVSRQPCQTCNGTAALIRRSGGQAVVRCRACKTFIYNAPKYETGDGPRTVASVRRDIKPGQQQRILERDGQACVMCHRFDVPLTIGHVLSVKEAQDLGEVGPYMNSDENLVSMCEACNLGLGGRSLLPTTYARIVLRLLQAHACRIGPADRSTESAAFDPEAVLPEPLHLARDLPGP